MTATQPLPLHEDWKERLGLSTRRSPELYTSPEEVIDAPHAVAIRTALDELGLSAVFCVQGVPTVAILCTEQYERARIVDLHGALWNQGLASLLLVIADDSLRAFSLARKPYKDWSDEFERRCLIETLDHTADALKFHDLVYGAESGRLWKDYAEYFRPKERVDQVLLENLTESYRYLRKAHLSSDAAQALLIQAMFIAYLEDRKIITGEYFNSLSGRRADSFASLLATGNTKLLHSLFRSLRTHFNGDLFVAPSSFKHGSKAANIEPVHLDILARFRTGREEMAKGGQLRFWGYDFRYVPIELVSAVYDRFLGEKEEQRRAQGAYYTPMFLADTVVSQLWDFLPFEVRENGRYLDPACGSGVFLVRAFQRLCEHWRATRKSKTIRWDSLLGILQRIHGWDLHESALRVAVFSLYVALLEEVTPPDIRRLIIRGKILPELWSKTLVCRNFFDVPEVDASFDVIVGNPPWTSRRGIDRHSVQWCQKNAMPMPGGEDAWAFAWKAPRHLTPDGVIAFLLPAMGFLHNHAANTVAARQQFFRQNHVRRIINFADLRFQLFEHAHRPAALIIYAKPSVGAFPYRFDYWAPKADLNLQLKRLITLSSADKLSLSTCTAIEDPLAFKQRLWMREPDAKLFAYLSKLPRLGDLIKDFGSMRRRKQDLADQWIIGQGFQPLNDIALSEFSVSRYVGKLPDLPIHAFRRFAQPTAGLSPWPSKRVRRKGFEQGFRGPRILVPRGVETSQMRLRAAYTEEAFTFQHIIQAIAVPPGQEYRAKLLTALLNSRVAVWYAFHGTSSFGSDRPEVQQAELLRLPFPSPADLPDTARAMAAAEKLVGIIEHAIQHQKVSFPFDRNDDANLVRTVDHLAYQYFCLSDDEIILIEDTVEKIIPAAQPHEGNYPQIWRSPSTADRRAYATTLVESVNGWIRGDDSISARLEASTPDLGVLRLSVNGAQTTYTEAMESSLIEVISRLSQHISRPLDGNFQLIPDLKVFIGKNLYLIKPMQLRFWLRATALADADAIAMDLQHSLQIHEERSRR